MAARYSALFICVLFCFSYVRAEDLKPEVEASQDEVEDAVDAPPPCEKVEDLKELVKAIEESVNKSKDHVDSMLNTSLSSHQEKLHPLIKKEREHLSNELKDAARKYSIALSVGEHTAAVKDVVHAAVLVLNDTAASLEHTGDDLKQQNTQYYEAASKVLQEVNKIVDVGTVCGDVALVLKITTVQIQYVVGKYEWKIYKFKRDGF